ncbi:flagellar biosynthesis protein FlhB [Crenobacter intestini]|uniref:Flagellar biosynthetic protein FlhB n=1 Tax=Crenobacter intestini TaxID=2563443 RepID=A0A4T0UJJ8_9NEIS|nr:flagellar biosynthesis protein FlhB [Crenobacter intestini]TIC78740.1 flagellar type III secretion system protein FlhB [Crenobacter intestini]
MAEDSDLERTEPASERRLSQAREEGNVPRSRELATFAVTMTGVGLLIALGPGFYRDVSAITRRLLGFDVAALKTPELALEAMRAAALDTLWMLLPFLGALAIVALFTPLLIGGWNLSAKAIEPKFSKLNPVSGLKRMVSVQALAEGGKAVMKSALIGGVATWVIWSERAELTSLATLPLEAGLARMMELVGHTLLIVAGALLLLVAVDVPLQLWQYHKKLKMTKEEVKQEHKEQQGSPEVKGRIRQLQREAARKRMMQEVPHANVIVTNPTHYAVALKYSDGMRAPQVVAKGTLKLAEKILETGREHKVASMRAPAFARALYFHAELGEDIPPKLFDAAAQVLAYIYQLRVYEQNGGLAPVYPDALEVPPELDPQSKKTAAGRNERNTE